MPFGQRAVLAEQYHHVKRCEISGRRPSPSTFDSRKATNDEFMVGVEWVNVFPPGVTVSNVSMSVFFKHFRSKNESLGGKYPSFKPSIIDKLET